ncbi:MAG: YcaO-like family protein [Magnetospirillum sp.]|nr:YcaO-like family protein [Magnetospirillum sp.]
MQRLEDLCVWIGGFARHSRAAVCFGEVPDGVGDCLRQARRFIKIGHGDPVAADSADFVLCLAAQVPGEAPLALDYFTRLLSPLIGGGVLLLTVPTGDVSACGRMERLLAHTGNISVVKTFGLCAPEWRGWLVHKTASAVSLPMPGRWDFSPGDEIVRAINGDRDAIAHVDRVFLAGHALADSFRMVFGHVRSQMEFDCTGWSLIESGAQQACFLAGLVRWRHVSGDVRVKRVSAAGTSWAEAAFLLLCEAIERHAQMGAPVGMSMPGAAFGLRREGAISRAVLENLERFHFHRVFFGKITPTTLDIRDDEFLAGLVAGLEAAGRRIEFFLLTGSEPFRVVLAVHTVAVDGRVGRFACGLGCNFSLADSARKALLEALKCDIYIDCGNIVDDVQVGAMTQDAQQKIAFWSDVANWSHMAFLRGGEQKQIGAQDPVSVSDQDRLDLVLAWCDANGIAIHSHPLLSPEGEEGAWVYKADCAGLATEYPPRDSAIPSPLF